MLYPSVNPSVTEKLCYKVKFSNVFEINDHKMDLALKGFIWRFLKLAKTFYPPKSLAILMFLLLLPLRSIQWHYWRDWERQSWQQEIPRWIMVEIDERVKEYRYEFRDDISELHLRWSVKITYIISDVYRRNYRLLSYKCVFLKVSSCMLISCWPWWN